MTFKLHPARVPEEGAGSVPPAPPDEGVRLPLVRSVAGGFLTSEGGRSARDPQAWQSDVRVPTQL